MKVWAPITSANSIHLSAIIQILYDRTDKSDEISLSWIPKFFMYPTKMTRGLDGFTRRKAIRTLEKLSELLSEKKGLDHKINLVELQKFENFLTLKKTLSAIHKIQRASHVNELAILNSNQSFLGSAIANLIANENQDEHVRLNKNRLKLWIAIFTYFRIYSLTLEYIRKNKPLMVYVYNGRFLYERAISDALRNFPNIEIRYFETIRNRVVITSHGFHNRILMQEEMRKFSRDFSTQEIKEIGTKYFDDLKSKKNTFITFKKSQVLPNKEYICYFPSSDDEYVGFWDSRIEHFGNQFKAISELHKCSRALDIDLVIRLHPNLANKPKTVQERWRNFLKNNSIKYFDSDDPISSQYILENSRGVVTYGSTIGLEAVASLKPSLVLVDCIYDLLGCVSKATSGPEIRDWLMTLHSPLNHREAQDRLTGACIRGLWIEKVGSPINVAKLNERQWGAWEATEILNYKIDLPSRLALGHVMNKVKRLALGCRY